MIFERFNSYGSNNSISCENIDSFIGDKIEIILKTYSNKHGKILDYIYPSRHDYVMTYRSLNDEENSYIKRFEDPSGFCLA